VPEVKIALVVPMPCGYVRIPARIPFTALHNHCCIWDERVSADMIEVLGSKRPQIAEGAEPQLTARDLDVLVKAARSAA
jgi:hypothetical protein